MADTDNQNLYMDEQNFDVDIDAIYQKFIIEINKLRSHVSVQSNAIQIETASNVGPNINVDRTPQESRCHAFYRLLGLPVVSSDGQNLYCPGYDKPNNNNKVLNDGKLTIAKNINKDLLKVMDARENTAREFLGIFSLQGLDASALVMSSIDTRPFSGPLTKSSDPFDTKASNQSYTVPLAARLITEVRDSSGNFPTKLSGTRTHLLKPFMVDPRIELTVQPDFNRICVPFLLDKSETKLKDNTYLKRPYIEKVCRERFSVNQKLLAVGDHTNAVIQSIKNDDSIKNEKLINTIFSGKVTSEQIQFANYLNIMRSMLKKLSDAINTVSVVLAADPSAQGQAKYNWVPIPSKTGPEDGCTTRSLSNQQSDKNNTASDKEIIQLQYTQEIVNINNKLKSQETTDLGGFAFDEAEITPDTSSSEAFGDKLSEHIKLLSSRREAFTNAANDSVKEIEIIMGEFSGLGLCDILAISAALWVVDKSVLINMIDSTAITRMLKDQNLRASEVTDREGGSFTKSPGDALKEFEAKVKEIFEIMDKMFTDIHMKNKR